MKKMLALILAMVMILSLSITASALELGEYIYLRIDIQGVQEVTTATLSFEGVEGGLHLVKNNRGLYANVYYDESLASACTLTVDYYDEKGEFVRLVSDPMYLDDIDGIIVLDEEGFHVENAYLFEDIGDRNSKTIPVTGIYAGDEEEVRVVSVDLEWGGMEFVFTPYVEWNPENHTYESVENNPGTWDLAENSNNHVKVTNHSNVAIDVSLIFQGNSGLGTEGAFFTDHEGLGDVINGFTVPSAVGTTVEAAPYDVAFLRITDGNIPEGISGMAEDFLVDQAGNVVIGDIWVEIHAVDTAE